MKLYREEMKNMTYVKSSWLLKPSACDLNLEYEISEILFSFV